MTCVVVDVRRFLESYGVVGGDMFPLKDDVAPANQQFYTQEETLFPTTE